MLQNLTYAFCINRLLTLIRMNFIASAHNTCHFLRVYGISRSLILFRKIKTLAFYKLESLFFIQIPHLQFVLRLQDLFVLQSPLTLFPIPENFYKLQIHLYYQYIFFTFSRKKIGRFSTSFSVPPCVALSKYHMRM